MTRVFISYRRLDTNMAVGRLYDLLVPLLGKANVFRDLDNIPAGRNFQTEIIRALNDVDIVFVMIGPNWLNIRDITGNRRLDNPHDPVRIEIETALSLQPRILVIPVLVGGTSMPSSNELPRSIAELSILNAPSLREDPDFKIDFERLMDKIGISLDTRRFPQESSYIPIPPDPIPSPLRELEKNFRTQLDKLQQRVQTLHDNLADTKISLNQGRLSASKANGNIQNYLNQLRVLNAEFVNLNTEISTRKLQNTFKQNLEELDLLIHNIQIDLEREQNITSVLTNQELAESQRRQATEAKVEAIRSQLVDLSSRLDTCDRNLQKEEQRQNDGKFVIRENIEKIATEVNQLEIVLKNLRDQIKQADTTAYSDLKATLFSLQSYLGDGEALFDNLKSRVVVATKNNQNLSEQEQMLQNLRVDMYQIEGELKEAHTKLNLDFKNLDFRLLVDRVVEVEAKIDPIVERLTDIRKKVDEIYSPMFISLKLQTQQEITKVEEKHAKYRKRVSDIRNLLRTHSDKLSQLHWWNPFDYLRLLIWIYVLPNQIWKYEYKFGNVIFQPEEKGEKYTVQARVRWKGSTSLGRTSAWLYSTIIWAIFLILPLGLLIDFSLMNEGERNFFQTTNFIIGLVTFGWFLTGLLSSSNEYYRWDIFPALVLFFIGVPVGLSVMSTINQTSKLDIILLLIFAIISGYVSYMPTQVSKSDGFSTGIVMAIGQVGIILGGIGGEINRDVIVDLMNKGWVSFTVAPIGLIAALLAGIVALFVSALIMWIVFGILYGIDLIKFKPVQIAFKTISLVVLISGYAALAWIYIFEGWRVIEGV